MSGDILVFSDEPALWPALLDLARGLAGPGGGSVVAVGLAGNGAVPAEEGFARGADRLIRLSAPALNRAQTETVGSALGALVRLKPARLLIVPSTKRGREYAARAAGILDAPIVTGVAKVSLGPDAVEVRRELLSGNAVGEEVLSGPFAIVAVQPETIPPRSEGPTPSVETLAVEVPAALTQIVESAPKPSGGIHLESAERILSVGRGLQKKDDLALVEEVARRLGATVGCTRPIAADAGWLSDDHWIGLTGHRVKPRLYVAVGISGAVQHLVGMRESKVVVAINKDANAPIFQQADFQVKGDLYQILPALAKLLPPR